MSATSFGRKIICAVSGGVDSAVAAFLLKQKYQNVLGVFMRNWDERDEFGHCQTDEDYEYASKVCERLKIPLTEVNFVKEYWNDVFQPFLNGYEEGHTPNPDILCNQYIKFNSLYKKCGEMMKDDNFVIATGHYAGTSCGESVLHAEPAEEQNLLRADDENKDQTFFLHKISSNILNQTYFPLQHFQKDEVKEIAANSPVDFTLDRKESTGICFIGNRKFSNFILNYLPPRYGDFIYLETDKKLASHNGYFKYTVGQKSGIGIDGNPYAVLHRDAATANIYVVTHPEHPALYSRSMLTENMHWISASSRVQPGDIHRCQFRINHRYPLINCDVVHLPNSNKSLVMLEYPMRALTPGQDAVLYDGKVCLGGATIIDVGPSMHECRSQHSIQYNQYRKDTHLWDDLIQLYGSKVAAFNDHSFDDKIYKYRTAVHYLSNPLSTAMR